MKPQTVIGLEIHVQLRTRTKLFCSCPNSFGEPPNTSLCPVCLGHPGALPVLNAEALRLARIAALALGAEVAQFTKWDRKNYLYPDLPKGYQITQYDRPLALGGGLQVGGRHIELERAHLEEDTGTSRHREDGTLIDFNRAGIPLLEIVTRPVLTGVTETVEFIRGLRELLRWVGVTDGDMEKGQLRAEPNINLSAEIDGTEGSTPIVELKNLNSLASVRAALEFEVERQAGEGRWGVPRNAGRRTTRGFDEARGVTVLQREKEEAHDYRYFPEPDLPPATITATGIEALRSSLPELPTPRRERLGGQYPELTARLPELTADRALADYFEAASEIAGTGLAGQVANWVMGEAARGRRGDGTFEVPPEVLGEIVALVGRSELTLDTARRRVWPAVVAGERPLAEIVASAVAGGTRDPVELEAAVDRCVAARPDAVQAFCEGKEQAIGPIIAAVLKETGGTVEPAKARELILRRLQELS